MNHDTLVEDFIKQFPKWGVEEIKDLRSWYDDDDDPYLFFGFVLNPLLEKKLTDEENHEELRGIFDFLEEMANTHNREVGGVLMAEILEKLGDDKKVLEKARALMGKETLKFSHQIERSWGREK
jgi:hypothetical protein